MTEIWKDVLGYEGIYQVSNLGQVKRVVGVRCRQERILKPNEARGYLTVLLSKDGKGLKKGIHRLMMEAFNPIEGMENLVVNHLDENPKNNTLENLCWATTVENNCYGTRLKRCSDTQKNDPKKSKPVRCIETGEIYPSVSEAARQLGVDKVNISRCCLGQQKTSCGYHWEYVVN